MPNLRLPLSDPNGPQKDVMGHGASGPAGPYQHPPAGGLPPEAGGQRNPNEVPLPLMYFEGHGVNPFIDADEDSLSTFALDGDTGSYEIGKLYLGGGDLPPPDAVRVEEWVNAFDQGYTAETDGLGLRLDGMMSPFGEAGYRLLRVGVASARPEGDRDPVSLIIVLDISGSMMNDDRLGLAKAVIIGLAERLTVTDRVGLVTYGSQAHIVYPVAPAVEIDDLLGVVAEIQPEGSTNLAEGIAKAYGMAASEIEVGHRVRVVVLSDGVGNVGATGPATVLEQVEQQARRDVTLTTVGVGISGNYNDVMMEALANRGNGTYHYLRGDQQAGEFLLESSESVFREVARDARVQVEFDPAVVRKYRLIGYENRAVADSDFRNDALDFGEPGFARDVTALYEIRLEDGAADDARVAEVRLRWHDVEADQVVETSNGVTVAEISDSSDSAAPELVRTAAVAEFAELMRKSYWAQCGSIEAISDLLGDAVDGELEATALVASSTR